MEPGAPRLAFADLPYNIGIDYGDHHNDRMKPADYLAWCRQWIAAAVRLLSPDGSMWLLCNHEWSARLQLAMEDAGLHYRQTITWYETFGVNCTRKFNRCSRPLLWMVRDPQRFVFNADAVRTESARQAKYQDKRANPKGKILDDVWVISRVAGTFKERIPGFPTQLPLELLRLVVGCASDPGDVVIDPFSGSATTGAACIELGRRYIGIEASEDFAERSRRRLASMTSGLTLESPHARDGSRTAESARVDPPRGTTSTRLSAPTPSPSSLPPDHDGPRDFRRGDRWLSWHHVSESPGQET
jgi:site-specific DNA-methyltransferase (adenine-specific)